MNTAPKKSGALLALTAMVSLPSVSWAGTYTGGTDYKITLPGATPAFSWQADEIDSKTPQRSEMLFKLSVTTPDTNADDESAQKWNGDVSLRRMDFLKPLDARMNDLHTGFSYSAGIEVKNQQAELKYGESFDDVSHFISSRQLGIHFGRLGSVNYSGVDLSFRQFNDKAVTTRKHKDEKELWSLGVTTGRRFSLTGLETSDPIWTVSLRGQFNLVEKPNDNVAMENQQWYLSPGLHWERDSFRMSADVLMPFLQSGEFEEETDYKIRAKIQKRF